MLDDKTITLLITTAVGAIGTIIGAILKRQSDRRKSRDDLLLDTRKAERERETAEREGRQTREASERQDLETQRATMRAEMLEQLAWYETQLRVQRSENDQLRAERDTLAKLLTESNKREEGHAEAMRNAVPFVKAGGGPCGSAN